MQEKGESINTGPDYWNGGIVDWHFFNVLYLRSYAYLTRVHTIVWLMVLDNLISGCGHPVHASMKITLNCDAV